MAGKVKYHQKSKKGYEKVKLLLTIWAKKSVFTAQDKFRFEKPSKKKVKKSLKQLRAQLKTGHQVSKNL